MYPLSCRINLANKVFIPMFIDLTNITLQMYTLFLFYDIWS